MGRELAFMQFHKDCEAALVSTAIVLTAMLGAVGAFTFLQSQTSW